MRSFFIYDLLIYKTLYYRTMFLFKNSKVLTLLIMVSFHFSFGAEIETVTNLNSSGNGSFSQALENVDEGGTINFDPTLEGIISVSGLEIERSMTINGNPNVFIDGGGTYKYKNKGWIDNLMQILADSVTINDLHLQNATGPNSWSGGGFIIIDEAQISNKYINLNRCSVINSKSTGLFNSTWVASGDSKGISNLTISDCEFSNNGASGIILSQGNHIVIKNTICNNNTMHGIYFLGQHYKNGNVIHNVDDFNQLKGINNSHLDNITASNNKMSGIVISENSNNNLIEKCTVSNNGDHGIILLRGCTNNTIYKNTCNDQISIDDFSTGILISEEGNQHNLVYQNTCERNSNSGIFIYNSTNKEISNNNLIIENTISDNGGGIAVLHAPQTYVIKNTIRRSNGNDHGSAIALSHASNHSIIANNTLEEYKNAGIIITDGDDTLSGIVFPIENDSVRIFGNTISDDSHASSGILLDSAKNTYLGTITHTFASISRIIRNPITSEEITSINIDLTPTANEIKDHQNYGIIVYKSQATMISQDLVHCNNKGSIIYVDVPQTILSAKDFSIQKDFVNNQLTISGFPNIYPTPVEAFLSQGSCTIEYNQQTLINSNNEIILDIPNLSDIDSILLHITNLEQNTYPVTIDLKQVITNKNDVTASMITYIQNGLFIIENGNNTNVIISNTQGQVIQHLKNVNDIEIGNSLSNGLYLIHLQSSNGEIITKKYLK